MDDASALEWELEQELLLESEQQQLPAVSTPRQRLEDARAMADGNCGVAPGAAGEEREENGCISYCSSGSSLPPEEGEQDMSTHLLQVRRAVGFFCCLSIQVGAILLL